MQVAVSTWTESDATFAGQRHGSGLIEFRCTLVDSYTCLTVACLSLYLNTVPTSKTSEIKTISPPSAVQHPRIILISQYSDKTCRSLADIKNSDVRGISRWGLPPLLGPLSRYYNAHKHFFAEKTGNSRNLDNLICLICPNTLRTAVKVKVKVGYLQ